MSDRHCRYCQQPFQLSPYHPNQFACRQTDCQQRRRRDYHRQKIASDPLYRQVCLDSCHQWREEHPDYWRRYRGAHPRVVERNRQRQQQRDHKRRLVHLANNNLAFDLKRSAAEVWLLGPGAKGLANNTLARCQVLIFQASEPPQGPAPASCQQHPSGFPPPSPLQATDAE
jgi:hypothetical protein